MDTEATSEGAYLKAVLAYQGISQRKAAEAAGLSEARLRQIIKGYQSIGGQRIPVVAPPETIAKIFYSLGLGHVDLVDADRLDALDAYHELRNATPERKSLLRTGKAPRLCGDRAPGLRRRGPRHLG